MTLYDSYLNTVGRHLPRSTRDDVLAEIRSEIEDAVARDELRLGRALDAAEQAAIVSRWGPPRLLAARYRSSRSLIGAALLPAYVRTTATAVVLAVALNLAVVVVVAAVTGAGWGLVAAKLPYAVVIALVVFGIFTLVFAALESAHPICTRANEHRGR